MIVARVLLLATVAALVLALGIGFRPVHADAGFGIADCGSAFQPVHPTEDEDVLSDPTGAMMALAEVAEAKCEEARSGPEQLARACLAGSAVLLIAAVVYARRRRARLTEREAHHA
ncbi:hypothetical protein HUT06_30825 [Actinomadura sp. NAK00032]|uniref:hypothetical protein n=1 Tax=Actinomadura sp. NAK00032 TaxID=2742128 RepID=UPI00159291B4|nr:hypothetical protein [Actinomadura sp. NAK00032]QKW37862.1 hypothetical protein HUT06_30825 [Actinomadura sp. NAK00032]